MSHRAGRRSLGAYPSGGVEGGGRVEGDYLRVSAPGDNLHKSFNERGLEEGCWEGMSRWRVEQVQGYVQEGVLATSEESCVSL